MTFFLGTHMPSFLEQTSVPLFVSDVTLRRYRTLPRARGPWALDSGGFSEIAKHGRWTVPAAEYVARVRRYRDEVGGLQWAAIQDWMCEEVMLRKTGLTVHEHQRRTVNSLLHLRGIDDSLPWTPVLQGWTCGQYLDHLEMYAAHGVDLTAEPIVGVGSVCRRQHMPGAARIVGTLADCGLRLHGFGFKIQGLRLCGDHLASSDSLAWSFSARREAPLWGHDKPGPGRPRGHINCANCLAYALEWRDRLLNSATPGSPLGQLSLPEAA